MKLTFKRPNQLLAQRLETARFILTPLTVRSAFKLTAPWRNDAEILAALYLTRSMNLLNWLHHGPMPNNVDRFTYAITPHGSATPIGIFTVRFRPCRTASTGVALRDRDWWGKGVTVEVRRKLMNHFFRHGGVDRFIGQIYGRNPASVFNYQRLGFQHIGTWHRHVWDRASGAPVDLTMFEMQRENWEKGPHADAD
ncbi:MAG: N-acetyltransferase [Hyphomicrobiales bacterium]|nr:MAG: N-acetyltransferase [Hyphomicrobiales bacterium]